MVVAKAAAMEVKIYHNCGNEVKVVVENVGLWQPRRGREGRHGGGGLAAITWGGIVSSSKSGLLCVGVGTERWGHDGAPSMMSSQVDLVSAGELQVERRKRSETNLIDSFHDAPCQSPTPWISPHALSTRRPFENFVPQLSSWKGGARHGAVRSRREVLVL
jgi:hypothetical protein